MRSFGRNIYRASGSQRFTQVSLTDARVVMYRRQPVHGRERHRTVQGIEARHLREKYS